MKRFLKKNLKIVLISLSLLITILFGSLLGMIFVYQKGFPQIKSLEDIRPDVMTALYDENNQPIKEFAIEKRIVIKSNDIPPVFKQAVIAAEDHNFYSHWGINFRGVTRAVMGKIFGRKWGGGSSITQQLARGLFLSQEQTISRKLKEMLLAIQIEKRYTKDQILTFYCNKVPMGSSTYGVEAASRFYFGKQAKALTLAEAALIAAVIPNPFTTYNVFTQPERVLRRRNHVLLQMKTMGFIQEADFQAAVQSALPERPFDLNREGIADYYSEEVRKYLESRYGAELLYTGGLKVYTTLNMELQGWAEHALKEGVRALDKRRGWRGVPRTIDAGGKAADLRKVRLASWKWARIASGEVVEGIVLDVGAKQALVRVDRWEGILPLENAKWTQRSLPKILKRGDVAFFRILKIESKGGLVLGLEQEPEVEGAILVMDNATGAIKAMVGGYSFDRSKWNRATQALRQPGSAFKPIIYTAALEHGFTPVTLIEDAPFSYIDEATGQLWEPQNYGEDFFGLLTMRRGLELSRNVVTARILQSITPEVGLEYARKFGFTSETMKPYMSMGLGSFEVTLKEMCEAFSVFPNYGTWTRAYFIKGIRDVNDYIIEENQPEKKQALEKDTAYIMNYMLQGVVQSGTGWRARKLPAPVGGKTGTSNEFMDAWFIGFTPTLTVGVWLGYDVKRTLGKDETGSEAASPIFVSFMEQYLAKYPETRKFLPPAGLVFVEIDKYTGKRFQPGCLYQFREAFKPGTEPGPLEFCNEEEHQKIETYYKKASEEDVEDGRTSRR